MRRRTAAGSGGTSGHSIHDVDEGPPAGPAVRGGEPAFVLVAAGALYLLSATPASAPNRPAPATRPSSDSRSSCPCSRADLDRPGTSAVDPAERAGTFERFHQVDQSSTRAHDGLGLGLHLAKELAEQLQGRVDVDSTPGRGSTFTVTVPTDPIPAEPVTVANRSRSCDDSALSRRRR